MVGVPGKSKGCVTCKKRRIKCDETKPACKRCEKSGYICGGYSTGLHFINTSTMPFETAENQSSSGAQYIGRAPVTVVPRMRTAALPPELSLIAFQPEVCLSFLMHNFVWRTYGNGWLGPAATQQLDLLATQAVRGLSNIFFGIAHRQEDVQLQACLYYGIALKNLRNGLADVKKPGIENLLIPILLLLMHASYEEDHTAALSHVKGLIMLMQIAGPHRFTRPPIRQAFESARATLATSFILARQPLFLASEAWKTIPWELDPLSKSQQNVLVDILVDVPRFLAEDDQRAQYDDPAKREDLQARVDTKLFELYCWRFTWAQMKPDEAFTTVVKPADAKPRVIEECLHFKGYEEAAEIQLYNAIQLFLLGLSERLSPRPSMPHSTAFIAASAADYPLPSFKSLPTPLLLPYDVLNLQDPAIEIVRTFEFQMSVSDNNIASNLFFLFPLGIAWEILKEESAYRDWMRKLLDSSEVTKGYAVGRNRWFGKYYLPKVRGQSKPVSAISG